MTERVTFFDERGPEQPGWSHRLEVGGAEDCWVLLAWTGQTGGPLNGGAGDREPVDALRREILERGGGVLAEVHSVSALVRLHRLHGDGTAPAHRLLRLSPFTGAGEVRLDDEIEEIRLRRGEHLLVPVSAEAERRLFELRDLLAHMGSDVEALVLHTLRSPSLESRLARLEEAAEIDRAGSSTARWWKRRHLGSPRPAAAPRERAGGGSARRRRRPSARLVAVLVVVLALALLAGWLLLGRRASDRGPAAEEVSVVGLLTGLGAGTRGS